MQYEEYKKMNQAEIENRLKVGTTIVSNSAKKVIDIDRVVIYPSARVLSEIMSMNYSTITGKIRNREPIKGTCYMFLKDYCKDMGITETDLLSGYMVKV